MEFNNLNQEAHSGTVIYTGNSVPGVPSGLPIPVLEFLTKIVEANQGTSSTSIQLDSDNIQVNSVEAGSGECVSGVGSPFISLSLSLSGNTPSLAWDATDVEGGLSSGYTLSTIRIIVTSSDASKGRLADSASISGGLPLSVADFPVQVICEAVIQSPCGTLLGRNTSTLTNPSLVGGSVVPLSFYAESTGPSVRSLTEVIKDLDSKVANTNRQILVGGELRTIREAILYLADKIENP